VAERVVNEKLSRDEAARAVRESAGRASKGRGRGSGKARKVTSRVFRAAGFKVTVENRRGVDATATLAALRKVVAQLEAEFSADDQAAA